MNVRQVRKKIKSISNVKKITKAMELVSAVKMKKAQQLEIDGRPYREHLNDLIQRITVTVDKTTSILTKAVDGPNAKFDLVILVTSNKGLCGAYNINLLRHLTQSINVKNTHFITIGKKGALYIGRIGKEIVADFSEGQAEDQISAIFTMAFNKYLTGHYNHVFLVYTKFLSTLRSEPKSETLLPFHLQKGESVSSPQYNGYLIEPAPEEILDSVLKSAIEERIRGAIISAQAVEHSARMIAMKNATDNANDVIYDFTLLGNKLRQEKITGELLDMITAKESVEAN